MAIALYRFLSDYLLINPPCRLISLLPSRFHPLSLSLSFILSLSHVSLSLYILFVVSLQVGKVQSVLCLDTDSKSKCSYKMWMDKVESEDHVPPHLPEGDDIATIIYTSGNTIIFSLLSFISNVSSSSTRDMIMTKLTVFSSPSSSSLLFSFPQDHFLVLSFLLPHLLLYSSLFPYVLLFSSISPSDLFHLIHAHPTFLV